MICRAAGTQGGFLYGMRNHFNIGANEKGEEFVLESGELDLICKILECEDYVNGRKCDALYDSFRLLMTKVSTESKRVNAHIIEKRKRG